MESAHWGILNQKGAENPGNFRISFFFNLELLQFEKKIITIGKKIYTNHSMNLPKGLTREV